MNQKIDTARLLAGVDIVEIVGADLPLKRAGVEFSACCPFHTEATPSFMVSKSKQLYYCFGCGATGDAISWLREYHSLSFQEACERLGAGPAPSAPAKPAGKSKEWTPIMPVPRTAAPVPRTHLFRGEPEAVYPYRSLEGALLGYTYRLRNSEGGKEVLPLVWARNQAGEQMWRWLSFAEPRPLYGLERLSGKEWSILLVEGEKCVEAGRAAQDAFAVLSWPGGGKGVRKADWAPLAGQMVTLWADCDAKRVRLSKMEKEAGMDPASKPLLPEAEQPGVAAMRTIAANLLALDPPAAVFWVPIPAPGEKPDGWDIADAIGEGLAGEDLVAHIRTATPVTADTLAMWNPVSVPEKKPRKGNSSSPCSPGEDELPAVHIVAGESVRVVDRLERLLYGQGDGPVYQRGGIHVRISRVDQVASRARGWDRRAHGTEVVLDDDGVSREPGAIVVSDASTLWVREECHRRARFLRFDKRADDWIRCDLKSEYVDTMLARPDSPAPVLRGLVEAPLIRRDGSILSTPGYDLLSQVYFHSDVEHWKLPPVRQPGSFDPLTDEAIVWAKRVFWDFFGPFSPATGPAGADFSSMVAGVLTALMRPELGPAPGFFYGAPGPGSGKSYVAHMTSIVATGREAPMMTLPVDDAALGDAVFSALRAGDSIICIDNIEKPLISEELNMMLTTTVSTKRVKGVHENQTVRPSMTTFLLTGNNPQVWGDGTTRWLNPYLDPGCENPQNRKFDRNPLAHAKRHRPMLVLAGLTLLKGYADAGRPDVGAVSRFAAWSEWVQSCLIWAGLDDPCKTMSRWTVTDEIKSGLGALLAAWHERYHVRNDHGQMVDVAVTAGEVIAGLSAAQEDLRAAIVGMAADAKGNPDPRRLGNQLKKYLGRIEGGYKLVMTGQKKAGALLYKVEKVS